MLCVVKNNVLFTWDSQRMNGWRVCFLDDLLQAGAILKNWEWPGNKAGLRLYTSLTSVCVCVCVRARTHTRGHVSLSRA